MVRAAHHHSGLINDLVMDGDRLAYLSSIAKVNLEPYPVDVARSHLNYYPANVNPLALHSDGAALVEIIPLTGIDDTSGTLVCRGVPERVTSSNALAPNDPGILFIPHGRNVSTILQGRRLLHSATVSIHRRSVLVIAMRSRDEPWKDDNTISRLAMDYTPPQFLHEWINDELTVKLPSLRRMSEGQPGSTE
jgi:hypothetical protein